MDLLQFLIDDFFANGEILGDKFYVYPGRLLEVQSSFSDTNPGLANSLKRDGFIVVGQTIRKLLPEEIQEAKIESELMKSLDSFAFDQSRDTYSRERKIIHKAIGLLQIPSLDHS